MSHKNMDKNKIERLKEAYKNIPIPSELDNVVQNALMQKKTKRKNLGWIAGVAAAAVIFTSSLNLSPAFAQSLKDIPVVGSIVNVLTIQDYSIDEGNYEANIKVPAVENLENESLEQSLNNKYLEESQKLYETFMNEMETQKAFGEDGHLKVDSGYIIKTETDQLLSIGRYVEETVASSMTTIQYDTIDKKNELLVTLPSLFKDNSYVDVISTNILEQMNKQMAEDSSKIYFIESIDYPDGFKEIALNQNFYINSNNELVIAFNEYDVAPGYMGPVEFIIPTKVLQEILVSNEYLK
ncbi:anti-sigma-V factor RsiV [Lysinibacillus sp. PLM2]|nr:anti-sigma-V factor RsiV [Lysinibacillus sp. PLM2]